MSDERFCVNCGRTDLDLICSRCNENNIVTYEKKKEQNLISEFLVDLKRKYRNDVEYTIMVEKWEKRKQ